MDEYLPPTTQAWVDSQLEGLGYSSGMVDQGDAFADGTRVHNTAYLQLRAIIREHIESQNEPKLEECVKPTGGWGWEPSRTDFESQEMDIYNEGVDVTAEDGDAALHNAADIKVEYQSD